MSNFFHSGSFNIAWFVGVLVLGGVLFAFLPKEDISEDEKRSLAKLPKAQWAGVWEGKFMDSVENYYADNFLFRNTFIQTAGAFREYWGIRNQEIQVFGENNLPENEQDSLKTEVQDSVAKPKTESRENTENQKEEYQDIKSVIVYKNRAIQAFAGSQAAARRFANLVRQYKRNLGGGINYFCMAIPIGSDFYLPQTFQKGVKREKPYIDYLYRQLDSTATCVPVYDSLANHTEEYLQFNTDHHWTGRAAFYGYQAFCKVAGFEALPLNALKRKVIPNFLGSLYYYTRSQDLKKNLDSVEYFKIPTATKAYYFTAENLQKGNPTTVYVEFAKGVNAYGVFLGQDYPMMRIVSEVKNGRKILQIKDSYGNAFAPFLPAHFEETIVIDYRYFTGSLSQIVKKYGITDIIFSHNVSVTQTDYAIQREREMLGQVK